MASQFRSDRNPHNLTQSLTQKFTYSKHLQRLMNSKSKVDAHVPRKIPHLAPEARNIYIGAGPRLSLDQKINFINENNCLAKRITCVGNRETQSKQRSKSSFNQTSRSSFKLPGIDHKVGSLNGEQRFQEFRKIARYNLMIAKKLIDTKSVVNYDEHAKHAKH